MKKRFSLTAALAICAVCTALGHAQTSSTSQEKPERLAGLEPSFIDKNADPCTNFFQYACGNFSKQHPIPADRSGFGTMSMLYDENQSILHSILEKASTGGASRTPNEQKTGDYYASCMDVAAINQNGLKGLQPELDRIAALKSKDQLAPLLAHLQLINVNAFIGFGEQQDFGDATRQIASIDQAGLGLPEKDYYLRTGEADQKLRQQYVEHVTNTFRLLGEPDAKAAEDAKKVMDIETELAKNSLDVTSQRDPNNIYHMTSVADFEKMTPAIDWNKFLSDVGAPPVEKLNVTYPPFFKALNSLIESTDLETIKTYLRWQLITNTPSTALPEKFDQEHFNFYGKTLSGQQQQQPRWKRCVAATDGALGEALGEVYVKQAFPASSKAATQQMVRDIESAMDKDLDTLDWMSADTKAKAKQKLNAIANKIGYPDKWRDYSSLKIERGDALGNAIRAIEFENHRQLNKIGKPVDRGEFGMSPPTVNAYYSPTMNDINFPAGILQPPFWDSNATDAENYGHIGAVVGHELTHGFDDEGRQFDAAGNLKDWWTAEDAKKFEAKADCEVKEYNAFTVPGDVHVNGKLTLGENTADNGGLRLAYMALLEDAKRKSLNMDEKKDGYTPQQQFFIAFGQNWCGELRPQRARMQVQTDPHSPQEFRVNGVVRNMPEFGQAFNCKQGQPMMPDNMCRVW
ncbi:M13 family metallopeptidase [Occallatibacter riparius]|uniref:M13 family metallopeptidase n=1 Tax=Occallatibacter riparius TaxID=1002689 RepID=A0A9J7BY64_9BACT|nr:M13 family metallopeptidase [Occallatibacter riparius]UWZ86110.1 M13 family metallopeptidase [Occallatibacter riparius]